jgi:hypoxanthine phosphoribosyltransferase
VEAMRSSEEVSGLDTIAVVDDVDNTGDTLIELAICLCRSLENTVFSMIYIVLLRNNILLNCKVI